MTPYRSSSQGILKSVFFSLFVLFTLGSISAGGSFPEKDNFDALTQSGLGHYYSLEYDQAIRDFQKALEARPDDAKAINHLLEAELFLVASTDVSQFVVAA